MENNIKKIIADKGYKQKYVAESIGVSQQQLSNWINGNSTPHLKIAYKLAKFLDVEITELWEMEE